MLHGNRVSSKHIKREGGISTCREEVIQKSCVCEEGLYGCGGVAIIIFPLRTTHSLHMIRS